MAQLIQRPLIKKQIEDVQKFEIGFLVLWVGTLCSLKCRDCGNLIPYAKPESYSIDQTISDLKKLLSVCKIQKLQIQGGEPFTHPNIGKLLCVIDKLNIPEIVITTNGTIKLNSNIVKQLKCIENPSFQVVISSYECAKTKQNEFFDVLINNNINCIKYNFFQDDGSWVNQGGLDVKCNTDNLLVQKLYDECKFKVCLSLVNGELFRCGRAKVSSEVYHLQYTNNDFLDIRKIHNPISGFEEISQFMNNLSFKEYCRYCLGTEEKIPAAIQLSAKNRSLN